MGREKDINNRNDKGKFHGYNEWYLLVLTSYPMRATYKNGEEIGYEEDSWNKKTKFYIR